MRIKLQRKPLVVFYLLLAIEISIALFVHDGIIRPFVGDMLVIWLMVYFFRSFVHIKKQAWFIIGVWLFACLVEVAQYFHVLQRLNLQGNRLLFIVFGTTFDWLDIGAYTLGAGFLLLLLKLPSGKIQND